MDKKEVLKEKDLNNVSGGLANPIYTAYYKDGALRNPDTGEAFKSDKEAWEFFRSDRGHL